MAFLEFLLFLSPMLIGAIVLWCFGTYIARCARRWICIVVSLGAAVVNFGLFWSVFLLLDEPFSSFTVDLIGACVMILLCSWVVLRQGYRDQEGRKLTVGKSLLLAVIYTVIQGGASFGAGILLAIEAFSHMHFNL